MNDSATTIGVDVGGTKIYAARYLENGNILSEITLPTDSRGGRGEVIKNVVSAIKEVMDLSVFSIGIAWAGFVDAQNGVVRKSANIPEFENYPLAENIRNEFLLPVVMENDARLFAFAEAKRGVAQGLPNVLGVILGTGVGSGIVINNNIYKGRNGFAGEIGHMLTHSGQKFESHISGTSLQKMFRQKGLSSNLADHVQSYTKLGSIENTVFGEWLDYLSQFSVNLLLAFNPDAIVFGGGVGKNILPHFLPLLLKNVNTIFVQKGFPITVDLRIAKLDNAGALGAAMMGRGVDE